MAPRRRAVWASATLVAIAASLSACEPAPAMGPAPNVAVGQPAPITANGPEPPPAAGIDDNPMTHVERLKNPAARRAAVSRLKGFFEDAMTRDDKNREGPTVKPLLDRIVRPLNEVCSAGVLDEATTLEVVKLLGFARHPDGAPCLVKALQDYQPDVTEEHVRWAARAVTAMKLRSAAGALLGVFTRMKPSRPKARAVYRDVYDAMVTLADPSWEPTLIANLQRPVTNPKGAEAMLDEVQWSIITSAKVLGDMKSEKAVPALLGVMLTPAKADAHTTSVLALVKVGKTAATAAIALLEGKNKELVEYARAEASKQYDDKPTAAQVKQAANAHVATAALVLATIGRSDGTAPLLAAIEKADPMPRAIIARELPKLPKTQATVDAFQKAFEKTTLDLTLPPAGQNARDSLLDAMPTFFDASLVPWLIKQATTAKGDENDVASFKEAALVAILKVMKPDQLASVEKLAATKSLGADGKPSTVGKQLEPEIAQAKALLQSCGVNLECYLGRLADPAVHQDPMLFTGVKAVYMVGVLGSPEVKDRLIELMPKLTSPAIRGLAASVIDFHSPRGDRVMADKLQKVVDEVETTRDPKLLAAQSHLRYTVYRLNARAD